MSNTYNKACSLGLTRCIGPACSENRIGRCHVPDDPRHHRFQNANQLAQEPSIDLLFGHYLIRNHITILAGEAGIGKTTLEYSLAVEGAKGRTGLGYYDFPKPIRTLFYDFETLDSLKEMKLEALEATKEDREKIMFDYADNFFDELDEIAQGAKEEEIDLVIIDPPVMGFPVKNRNLNEQANEEMKAIRRLAREGDCAVLLTLNVASNARSPDVIPVYKGKGAKERLDRADIVINLEGVKGKVNQAQFTMAKNRVLGGAEAFILEKMENKFTITTAETIQELTKIRDAQRRIVLFLVDCHEPVSRKEIVGALQEEGCSRATTDRALLDLVSSKKITKLQHGLYENIENIK